MGKRTLKFRDWGKIAATFLDLATGLGVRVVALEESREVPQRLYPDIESKKHQPMLAYRELPDRQLFYEELVRVAVDVSELPGHRGERVICSQCGEGVNFGRFVEAEGKRLCLSCAQPELCYWTPVGRLLPSREGLTHNGAYPA